MEIPYIVNPRKDTGLINSKIAIWLFLASEVMLFGGFFSAYVYLRLGADYPWPERTLPVLPGLINTFILIASSVTVVFAWVALKLGNWRQFQIYMGITVACAAIFMVLKGLEYNVKFQHQAARLHDYTIVEGHLGYQKDDKDELVLDRHGKKIEENMIRVVAEKVTVSVKRYHAPWVNEMLSEAKHNGSEIKLSADIKAITEEGGKEETLAKAGEPLSLDLLEKIKKAQIAALRHNAAMRTAALRMEWKETKKANPGKKGWQLSSDVNIDMDALSPRLLTEVSNVEFTVDPPTRFLFKPRDIKEGATSSRLRDDTVIAGAMEASPMVFHNLDAIDFQWLVMRAKERGADPDTAIANSWLMKNSEFVREAWAWHLAENVKKQAVLNERFGFKEDGKTPKETLTHKELYRIGWKELGLMGVDTKQVKIGGFDKIKEEFMGPNYKARGSETYPELSVPREEIRHAAKFTPAWNTYYAIYFTITGLHGLHVIGGALVLLYYLVFGRKMFLSNPEWLANRVEVGGLFWHFVDLVWIFAFPIFYLM
jgi:heme/copper-type cytochrome/quinol oxidase subunit 3